jgi:hypothetical protein
LITLWLELKLCVVELGATRTADVTYINVEEEKTPM